MKQAIAVLMLFAAGVTPAGATDRGDWFKSLLQPGTGKPCCDISHCFRTDADWRNGAWWAELHGHWVPVPPATILRDAVSIDGSAYVCAAVMPMGFARPLPAEMAVEILRDGIYCFVPPDMGS